MPTFELERALGTRVAGLDEAGRGPWAGPVVAACVLLDPPNLPQGLLFGIDDSKKLTRHKRETAFAALTEAAIMGSAWIGIGEASVAEIDEINVLGASLLAMQRAFDALEPPPAAVLVDGNQAPSISCPVHCVIKGDSVSVSIAAASIVAKVTRDRTMTELAHRYPEYGWDRNAGYGTKEHQMALSRHGVTPEHRRTFKPIRNILTQHRL
jgi:ribonuclease HII